MSSNYNQEDLGQNSKSLKRQRKHVEEHDQFTEFRSHRLQSDEFSLSSVNLENSPKHQQSLTELLRAQLSDSPKNSHDLDLRSPSPSIKLESKEECAVEEYINSFLN